MILWRKSGDLAGCYHGGRDILWLPYQGWNDINDVDTAEEVNVTYYGSDQALAMTGAWRKNNPKNSKKPYCVVARMLANSPWNRITIQLAW